MKIEDTRVQFSKKQFQEALLRLMETKSAPQVTVTDLCREAGLNRGTFYLHYGNPMDVLSEVEDAFLERNLPYLREFLLHRKYEGNYFHVLMEHLAFEKNLMLMLMGPNGSPAFQNKYASFAHDVTLEEWGKLFPECDAAYLEFMFDFSFTGFSRIILNYFDGTLDMTEEELGRRMKIIGLHLMRSLDEFA